MLPGSFQLPVAIILLGGGLLACFLGYRLFRFVLAVYGLVAGAVVTFQFIGSVEPWVLVAAVAVGALAGALAFLAVYFIGVAIVGAGLGALIVNLIWTQRADDPHVLIVILFAIVGAFAALLFQRYVIVVSTAFAGAWTSIVGGLALMGDAEAIAAMGTLSGWVSFPLDRAATQRAVLVAWLGVGLLGVAVQLIKTGRGKGKRRNRK